MSTTEMTKPEAAEAVRNTCVWFEIPVSDLDRARAFYAALMQRDMGMDDTGPNPMVWFSPIQQHGVGGHLYAGKPAAAGTGPTIHLAAPDGLDACMKRIRENGGTVVSDVIEIPAGKFFYATDPDGNSIGLFAG
jgi:predicted enzyme related to lactoylglutathione lyase